MNLLKFSFDGCFEPAYFGLFRIAQRRLLSGRAEIYVMEFHAALLDLGSILKKYTQVKTKEKGVDRSVDILHTLGFPMEGWPSG